MDMKPAALKHYLETGDPYFVPARRRRCTAIHEGSGLRCKRYKEHDWHDASGVIPGEHALAFTIKSVSWRVR